MPYLMSCGGYLHNTVHLPLACGVLNTTPRNTRLRKQPSVIRMQSTTTTTIMMIQANEGKTRSGSSYVVYLSYVDIVTDLL